MITFLPWLPVWTGIALLTTLPAVGGEEDLKAPARIQLQSVNPAVRFENFKYSVWRNAGEVTLLVIRDKDQATEPLSVDYTTHDITAVAGQDYQPVSGTLRFQPGSFVKSIKVPLLPAAGTGPRTFVVRLVDPSGADLIGVPNAAVDILDLQTVGGALTAVAPEMASSLTITTTGPGVQTVRWTNGAQLQFSDGAFEGWQTLSNSVPPLLLPATGVASFFRIKNPRPASLFVPSIANSSPSLPLIVLLHAYGNNAAVYHDYMRLAPLAEAKGFLLCLPDGTKDRTGHQFWNATDACCAALGPNFNVDDSGYLGELIGEVAKRFPVNPKRISLIGHSNGGFMAYRLACDHAELIASIAVLAGATFLDPSRCSPSQSVHVLHIHGTADNVVPYEGGFLGTAQFFLFDFPRFPGAIETVRTWAHYNHCTNAISEAQASLDLDLAVPGVDTVVTRYDCPFGGTVELWTIKGGSHGPTLFSGLAASEFSDRVTDWLLAHPKP